MPMNLGLGLGLGSRGDTLWWLSGSELDLDFSGSRAFNRSTGFNGSPNSILTYTSPSPKLVYGDDGVLRYAPHNFLTYSQQFDNAAWALGQATISANTAVAPDGTTTADTLLDTAVTNIHHVNQSITALSPANKTYTVSVYLKASTLGYATVGLSDISSGTLYAVAVFNLSNGTLSTSGAVGTGYAVISTAITDAGNGWYRCSVVATAGTSVSFLRAVVGANKTGVITGSAGGFESYLGNGSGLFVWGAQVSQGVTLFDYLPTTSAARYSLPIDHDPITFDPLGVLIEEQRTNLLTYSEQFDNAAWTKGNSTVTANAAIAPDGTTTADLLYPTTTGTDRRVIRTVAGLTPAANYAASVYVKAAGKSWVYMIAPQANAAADVAWFDVANGVVGTKGASVVSTSITDVGGGWYRCVLVGPADGSDSFAINVADGDNTFTATTSGTNGVYLWGAQLEAGAFPTSYIPTVASQVTRAADQVSILTSAFAYNQTEGTLCSTSRTVVYNDGGAAYRTQVSFRNAGNTNFSARIRLQQPTTTTMQPNGLIVNTTTQADLLPIAVALTEMRAALAYKLNNAAMSVNGAAAVTDGSCTIPSDISSLEMLGGAFNNGATHIKRLTYFPTRRSNADLQVLTT